MSTELMHFDAARRSIEQASRVDEVKDIRDKAEALRQYARQQKQSVQMQNRLAEIKLRAERRGGELLVVMPKANGVKMNGKDEDGEVRCLHDESAETLSSLGISHAESHRWQAMAKVPEEAFEKHVADTKAQGKLLTSAAVYDLARRSACGEPDEIIHEDKSDDLNHFIKTGIRFPCIYADPAWQYGNQATRSSTDNNYPTMPTADICALPVKELADENAHLHLWTTNAFIAEAINEVMPAWGFTYKSMHIWVKPQMGIGNYWRVSHEILLFGLRGKLPFRNRGQMSWTQADRTRHSAKPEQFRKAIELVSPGPRLELFARIHAPGWSAWGNEIQGQGLYGNA